MTVPRDGVTYKISIKNIIYDILFSPALPNYPRRQCGKLKATRIYTSLHLAMTCKEAAGRRTWSSPHAGLSSAAHGLSGIKAGREVPRTWLAWPLPGTPGDTPGVERESRVTSSWYQCHHGNQPPGYLHHSSLLCFWEMMVTDNPEPSSHSDIDGVYRPRS